MWAASENDTAGLEELLKRPLNPMAICEALAEEDIEGMTALHYAAEYGRVEPMQLLLEARAEINANTSSVMGRDFAPLHLAVRRGHLEAVRFLVENGAEKEQPDHTGAAALELAVDWLHFDIARFLVQVGAGQDPVLTKTSQLWPLAAYSLAMWKWSASWSKSVLTKSRPTIVGKGLCTLQPKQVI